MRWIRLIIAFIQVSARQETAYRANFWVNLMYSLMNLATGILGIVVLFSQVQSIQGWDFPSTLGLLGVYLLVLALRGLFIGPGLDSLAGMDGDIWSGRMDFTLLRPINTQFLVSLRKWSLFSLLDLAMAIGVLVAAFLQTGQHPSPARLLVFFLALAAGVLVVYAVELIFSSLAFWSPGFLFTWVLDSLLQMARFPVAVYPPWLRFVLTWILPVGVITTIPAQALSGTAPLAMVGGGLLVALLLAAGASVLFRVGVRRYASASS